MDKPSVFISYSHKDEEWEEKFRPHLKMLEKLGKLVYWDDRMINPGKEWYDKIKLEMSKAAVAVCLISADYLSSDFVLKEEIPFLLERRRKEGMEIIPVLLRPCLWQEVRWLEKLQMLPSKGKSIAKDFKEDYDEVFTSIVKYITEIIKTPDYSPPKPTILWQLPEKIYIDRLPVTGAELFGREKELKQLDEAWKSSDTNIISFIAWGGVGKSTLINKWLEYSEADNYKDAERVFAWSFYSQGTNEQVSSADSFISEALSWFGDYDPTSGSAWDKGQRLAGLIRQKKTIIILDGMEPLQSSHEFERGKIKDQGLAALIRSLARDNNGLCIITSREEIDDIKRYEKKANQFNLEEISKEAGRALLRVGGVKGTDKELEAAVEAFGKHALAVKLLPVYLQSIKGHHISDALKIPDLNIPDDKGKHPRRVIEALFQRFKAKPEGDLLKMLGFFDRPADIEAIKKIIEQPVIEDLTGNLCNTGETNLLQAINILRNKNLLAKESEHRPHTLNCHPLIREHFGEKLQQQNPNGWKQAHARLYEYYRDLPEKELPDTLEEMEPLFTAVMHGCLAEQHQGALYGVFWGRIRRQKAGYDVHELGATGADLSCISNFFEIPWHKPISGIPEPDKAAIFSWAGYALRSVVRLSEAAQPMKTGLEMRIKQENWKESAIDASNLSELYLALGNVASAQKYGEQSVIFADRSGDDFWKEASRCKEADALHQAGKNKAAEKLFIVAENMWKQTYPRYLYLGSLFGFRFCDLLLSIGNYQEVIERAKTSLKWITHLLDIAHDKLSIGKAYMLLGDFAESENYLNQAIDGLRKAGKQQYLPTGLFVRATFSRHQKDFHKSWTDLDEALETAEYGEMRLHLADYHLEACRTIKAQLAVAGDSLAEFKIIENGETLHLTKDKMQARFQEHFKEAERLVKETGYHRRDGELEELR